MTWVLWLRHICTIKKQKRSSIQPFPLVPTSDHTVFQPHVFSTTKHQYQQDLFSSRFIPGDELICCCCQARALMLRNTISPVCSSAAAVATTHNLKKQPLNLTQYLKVTAGRRSFPPSLHHSPLCLFVFAENWTAAGWVLPGAEGQSEDRHRGGVGLLQDSGAARWGGWRWARRLLSFRLYWFSCCSIVCHLLLILEKPVCSADRWFKRQSAPH